jgi:hypothetical protein
VRSILRLLQWWWIADRIRISPREGRLLRLNPGSFLLIAGEPARILERNAEQGCVRYVCSTATGVCNVIVRPRGDVLVCQGNAERLLNDEQVEAIPDPACSMRFNF